MFEPPATLGFTFPLNQKNIDEKWEELISWMGSKAGLLKARTLTFAGRAMLYRSLVLSKIWYTCSVATPNLSIIKRIQHQAWEFIWNNSKLHPAAETAKLPKSHGGINAPDVELHVMTYAASLFQHAFNNPDKVWAKHVLHLQAKACKGRAFWDAMTVKSVRQL